MFRNHKRKKFIGEGSVGTGEPQREKAPWYRRRESPRSYHLDREKAKKVHRDRREFEFS